MYRNGGKRAVDLALTIPGLVLLSPVLGILLLLLLVCQGRPAIFRQARVGRYGRPFELVKFRTMIEGSEAHGTVTAAGDPRVTRLGRTLRRLKLDELPQLVNVLRGDMALVGPRPELAEYVAKLGADRDAVLSVRPGITALSSVRFRNEESLLAASADPLALNDQWIYPLKTRLNVWYVHNVSLRLDLKCMVGTFFPSMLSGRLATLEDAWNTAERLP